MKYNHKDNISDAILKEITSEIKTVSNHYFRNQSKFINTSDDFNEILNLKSILKDESLVLLKSDKGTSLVVLDTVKYFTLGHSFFSTESFERSVNENEKNFNRLKTFLAEFKNKKVITVHEYDLMTPSGYRSPIAYVLPKTHKPDFKTNLKFRPIISSLIHFLIIYQILLLIC